MADKERFLLCDHCTRMIKSKDDLAIAFSSIFLNAYHLECYAQESKYNIFLDGRPINSVASNISITILGFLGVSLFFIDNSNIYYGVVIPAIIFLSIRLYAWLKYESIFD